MNSRTVAGSHEEYLPQKMWHASDNPSVTPFLARRPAFPPLKIGHWARVETRDDALQSTSHVRFPSLVRLLALIGPEICSYMNISCVETSRDACIKISSLYRAISRKIFAWMSHKSIDNWWKEWRPTSRNVSQITNTTWGMLFFTIDLIKC